MIEVKLGINMTREFVRLFEFEKQCKSIGLSEDDILGIEIRLLADPLIGKMIQSTGGIRKLRIALPNRGKSNGSRVIYVDFDDFNKTYFITAYEKSDMDNLSNAEKNELKQLVGVLKNELRKKGKK